MIGNDIVDLAQARQESNWQRRGFLAKLFTTHEQQLIQAASDPETMVWTLWSMKESAYKIIVRQTGQRFFAPRQLACYLRVSRPEAIEGSVFYQQTYQTTSSITDRHISSVAFSTDLRHPFKQVIISFEHTDYQHQHQLIRKKIKQQYATYFSTGESRIQIQKNEAGVPMLIVSDSFGKTTNRPISLSHHGRYGAFVIA